MKKTALALSAMMMAVSSFGIQRAIYVKQGDTYAKYNFGVASDLNFSNQGRTLTITGYGESIDLDKIDYITFDAPVNETALTPTAQKEKMISIGEAVNAKIDLNKVDEVLRMAHVFTSHYNDTEGNRHHPYSEFDVPREYWDVHNTVDAVRAMGKVFGGDFGAIRSLKAKGVDLYRASDYFGVYTADQKSETWKKTGDCDGIELVFLSQDNKTNYRARLEVSSTFSTWTTSDFICEAPDRMTLKVWFGDKEIGKVTFDTKIVQDKSIDLKVTAEAGGYVCTTTQKVVDNAITDNVHVTVDGEYFLNSDITIDGQGLMTYDTMKSAIKESFHYHDEDGNCQGEDPTELFAHLFRANSYTDVLKQLQVSGRVYDFQKLYDTLSEDADYDSNLDINGYNTWSYGLVTNWNPGSKVVSLVENNPDIVDGIVNHLANYSDVQFFYDGKPAMQGFMGWEMSEYTDEYSPWCDENYAFTIVENHLISVHRDHDYVYDEATGSYVPGYSDWYFTVYNDEGEYQNITVNESDVITPALIREVEYETLPVLVFPDLTSFAFEDYFDETSFKTLINDYEDIVDVYKKICNIKDDDYDY